MCAAVKGGGLSASHFGAAPAGTTVVKIAPEYFFAYNHSCTS